VEYVHGGRISAHYLDVLAVRPMMGRNFSEDEDRPHGPKAAVLSYSFWRNTFSSNPDILGQPILLKGEPYTVIGVLPEGATTPLNADLYTTLQPSREGEGGGTNFESITRLRDGATWQEANAEINRAWSFRANRFELRNNPGAQVTYLFSAAPEGRDRLAASAGAGADAGRHRALLHRRRWPGCSARGHRQPGIHAQIVPRGKSGRTLRG